jgi:hypothetical protein
MLFGYNTNVKVGDTVYHVQTEDRGTANALIDTTVYCRGRVLHRRTNNYFDLLPLNPVREALLRERLSEQHSLVTEEIKSGALHPPAPPAAAEEKAGAKQAPGSSGSNGGDMAGLALELINSKSWLQGKRAKLHVGVKNKQSGGAISGALVTARIDGAAEVAEHSTETGANGEAHMQFEMPRLAGAEPALIIEATQADSKGHLKFVLRARPKGPAA